MMSRYEAYMNGVALSAVHPELIVLDIQHKATAMKNTTSTLGNRHGSMLLDRYISGAQVTISFELHIYSISERQRILQEVTAWAMAGGVLETNDRPGQRLIVQCLTPPVITSAKKWTSPLSVTFAAYEHPFWEEKNPSTITLSAGTSGSGTLYVPGNAGDTVVEVTATPSSAISQISFMINISGSAMSFSDITATQSNPLKIRYDDRMIQSITIGSYSMMHKRSALSSDDLLVHCGKVNTVGFSSNNSAVVEFSARGLWL